MGHGNGHSGDGHAGDAGRPAAGESGHEASTHLSNAGNPGPGERANGTIKPPIKPACESVTRHLPGTTIDGLHTGTKTPPSIGESGTPPSIGESGTPPVNIEAPPPPVNSEAPPPPVNTEAPPPPQAPPPVEPAPNPEPVHHDDYLVITPPPAPITVTYDVQGTVGPATPGFNDGDPNHRIVGAGTSHETVTQQPTTPPQPFPIIEEP